MKTYIITLLGAGLLALSTVGCSTDRTETEHRNWDGSVTHETTTVHQNDITGSTSIDKDSTRTNR